MLDRKSDKWFNFFRYENQPCITHSLYSLIHKLPQYSVHPTLRISQDKVQKALLGIENAMKVALPVFLFTKPYN